MDDRGQRDHSSGMPKGDHAGRMHGFQLWANLPASLKMTAPRYQEVKAAEIPEIKDDDGTHVRLVCGKFWGKKGPVEGIAADPIYIDVSIAPGRRKALPIETTRHAFAYVFAGGGSSAMRPNLSPCRPSQWMADTDPPKAAENRSLVLFDRGDEVMVQAGDEGIRFLLVWETAGRASGLVRPDRDEHTGTTQGSLQGTRSGNVSKVGTRR